MRQVEPPEGATTDEKIVNTRQITKVERSNERETKRGPKTHMIIPENEETSQQEEIDDTH